MDRQRVRGDDRDAHAGRGDLELRDPEDLAGLVADLQLLRRPAVVLEGAGPRHDVEHQRSRERRVAADRDAGLGQDGRDVAGGLPEVLAGDRGQLGLQLVDAGLAGTRRGLVRRHDQRLEPELAVQRTHRRHHRQRRAVRVGDDPLGPLGHLLRVDLGHDERDLGVHPERAGVVDGDRAAGGGDRRPLGGDLVGHVEHRDVDAVEDLGLQLQDRDVLAADRQHLAGAAGRGDQADLAPRHRLAGVDDLDHGGADGTGRADQRENG
ncbi:hypothetical protein GCM10009772_33660 [Pseudonocardia alni subsp. carboxydivorans]